MSNPKTTGDTEKHQAHGHTVISVVDLDSPMLPLFICNESTRTGSSSYQMEKLTPSTPILMPKSRDTDLISSTTSAAELKTTPHCRKCPFPSCTYNKIGFHNIDSSLGLRLHMDDCHPGRTDHNGPFFCPVRTCEYAVLGFEAIDICMKHLSIHHNSSMPPMYSQNGPRIRNADEPILEAAKGLCNECSLNKKGITSVRPENLDSIHDIGSDDEGVLNEIEATESDSDSECYETTFFAETMTSIAEYLLRVLDHDMTQLARLLPQIHDSLQQFFHVRTSNAGSEYNTEVNSMVDYGALAFSTASTRKSSTSSSLGKRVRSDREQDDEDEDEEEDERPKKPKGGPEQKENKGPRYACPFHKKSPDIFTNAKDTKYRSCSGPGQTEVRRLKKHLLTVHKEDINEFQRSQIETILKVKRPREKDKNDVDKWKDLWQALFPNVVVPDHPFHDYPRTSVSQPTHDIDEFLILSDSLTFQLAENDGYILDAGTLYYADLGRRTAAKGMKVKVCGASGLSFAPESSYQPFYNAPAMCQVYSSQPGAPSTVPSHVNQSLLDLRPGSNHQDCLRSHASSDYDCNINPYFTMDPRIGSHAQQDNSGEIASNASDNHHNLDIGSHNGFLDLPYGIQPRASKTTHNAPITRVSENAFMDFSTQVTTGSQSQNSYDQNNPAGPSNLNFRDKQAQFTSCAINFDEGGAMQHSLQLESVSALLEEEIAATSSSYLTENIGEAHLTDMSQGLARYISDS